MKFRKKPVVIEAEQLTEQAAFDCLDQRKSFAFGLHVSGSWHSENKQLHDAFISIKTLEGVMRAGVGDWIIKGVKGELYPCKDDIFQATYEKAEDAT